MKKAFKPQSIILTAMLAVGFSAGILFLALMGSMPGKSDHAHQPASGTATMTSTGHELLDQFSTAFESAADKVNQSVVPIFSEQVTEVENPFASKNSPFHQFFGDDFFNHFFSTQNSFLDVIIQKGNTAEVN